MRRTIKLQVCAVVAVVLLAWPAWADEVVIGAELPLTGNVATWAGGPVRNGMELALDEINRTKAAGDHTVKLLIQDMASDRTQGITLASRMINIDKVSMIIGLPTSIFATAVAPLANQEKTPVLATAVSSAVTNAGPWSFKLWQTSSLPANAMANLVVNTIRPKNVVIVFNRDNDAYVEMAHIVRTELQKAHIAILADEGTLITDTDFTALASKIADLEPDVLFLSGVAESMANVVLQARSAGLPPSVRLIGMPGVAPPAYARIGGAAIDGTIFTGNYFVNAQTPVNKAFVENYRARFGQEPDEFAAAGYTMMMLSAKAIKVAGADRDKLRAALSATRDLPVVIGNGSFSFNAATREPEYGSLMLQWKDGKVVSHLVEEK